MAWFLFILATAAIVAVLVWDYRRKAARREAARKERFEQIFDLKGAGTRPGPAPAPGTTADAVDSAPPPPAPPAPRPAGPSRFLGPSETLAYLLLKTGLPDHEIFAHVSLAAVVGAPGSEAEREQRLRKLSRYLLDFVICDREMRIVAAVSLAKPAGTEAAGEERFKSDSLKDAGIRLVQLNAASLPRRDAMRALVYGAAHTGDGAERK